MLFVRKMRETILGDRNRRSLLFGTEETGLLTPGTVVRWVHKDSLSCPDH